MKRGVNFKDGQTETIDWKAQVSFHIKSIRWEGGGRRGGSEDWNKSAGDGRHGSPLADYITRFTIE